MKRETLRHPKTFDLMARLDCSRPEALGYLQLLWDFTGEVATLGNIGKWSDAAIATACEWKGEPQAFISSLIAAGWIDPVENPEVRLRIHDWADHCEKWVKNKLGRAKLDIRALYRETAAASNGGRTAGVQCTDDVHPKRLPSYPIQSNPIQSEPSSSPKLRSDEADLATAQWMFSKIQELQPKRKEPNISEWANTIRLMRERDDRTDKDIRDLFDKANQDDFWKCHILSPDKLRAKWDDLDLKLRINRNGHETSATGHRGRRGGSVGPESQSRHHDRDYSHVQSAQAEKT